MIEDLKINGELNQRRSFQFRNNFRLGPLKIAAYFAPDGIAHRCAEICSYPRGIVNWNDTEKTWGCPDRGSMPSARY
ncbi:MAG: hypothetical protein ABIZ04_12405 [Opitutus sp.]